MTISVEYVLADPAFEPKRAVDRAAGLDIKAYLLNEPNLFQAISTNHHVGTNICGNVYLDGKLIGLVDRGNTVIANESYYAGQKYLLLAPGKQVIVNAGFKVGLSTDDPTKIATMLVCPRSGLAAKYSITVTNAPGIVDEHYPDWVGVVLINHGKDIHLFSHGARIAQIMYIEACIEESKIVDELSTQGERTGGFSSTGI